MHHINKKEGPLIFGIFSLLVGNLLGRFGGQYFLTNFFEGLFTGLSTVLMLCFLVRFGKERRMNDKRSQN